VQWSPTVAEENGAAAMACRSAGAGPCRESDRLLSVIQWHRQRQRPGPGTQTQTQTHCPYMIHGGLVPAPRLNATVLGFFPSRREMAKRIGNSDPRTCCLVTNCIAKKYSIINLCLCGWGGVGWGGVGE
jgi:hypothetical protein